MQRNATHRGITLICPNCFTASQAALTIKNSSNHGVKFSMWVDADVVEWDRDASLSTGQPKCHCLKCATLYRKQGNCKELDKFEFGNMIWCDPPLAHAVSLFTQAGITVVTAAAGNYEDNRSDPEWFDYVDFGEVGLKANNSQQLRTLAAAIRDIAAEMPVPYGVRNGVCATEYAKRVLHQIGVDIDSLPTDELIARYPAVVVVKLYVDPEVVSEYADLPHTQYIKKCNELKQKFADYVNTISDRYVELSGDKPRVR